MQLTGILAEIIATKRDEVAEAKVRTPLDGIMHLATDMPATRGFRQALRDEGCALIAEIKTASPSRGLIRGDVNPLDVAHIYKDNGASCISVLTDEHYFRGSLERLKQVSGEVNLPILRKDFIIDPYQVYEARSAGADAILLIAACLEHSQLADLAGLAAKLGLDALIEVHNEEEMSLVSKVNADLVGINNRDLTTFKTDITVTGRLAKHAPANAVLVSESGLFTADDVMNVHRMGADAVLIGEAIMASHEIAEKVRELSFATIDNN